MRDGKLVDLYYNSIVYDHSADQIAAFALVFK